MAETNIRINEAPPNIIIEPEIFGRIKQFNLNPDMFRQGLVLAGAPESTADSLIMYFRPPTYDSFALDSTYDDQKHTINFQVGTQKGTKIKYQDIKPWDNGQDELNSGFNFSLAYHSKRIADVSNRLPDTLVFDRSRNNSRRNRLITLYGVSAIGASIGAQSAESIGIHAWAGSLLGGITAATLDISSLMAIDLFEDKNNSTANAEKLNHQRALEFAQSKEAKALFSNVAVLELN